MWRDFNVGTSIAESKSGETGHKQDDQTLVQKQVFITPGPACVLIERIPELEDTYVDTPTLVNKSSKMNV